jgi:hypothetical protein
LCELPHTAQGALGSAYKGRPASIDAAQVHTLKTQGMGHTAENGPTVFAHARGLGAEGIVSKKVDGAYQSGPCRVWIKVRNPASITVRRERSEVWNRRAPGGGCER